jgi:hypothetical protein
MHSSSVVFLFFFFAVSSVVCFNGDCPPGMAGMDCSISCPMSGCTMVAPCSEGRMGSGLCECIPGRWGPSCTGLCSTCGLHERCDDGMAGTGQCVCLPTYLFNADTNQCESSQCPVRTYGAQCESTCPSCLNLLDPSGSVAVCDDGYLGSGACLPVQCVHGILSLELQRCVCFGGWHGAACNQADPLKSSPNMPTGTHSFRQLAPHVREKLFHHYRSLKSMDASAAVAVETFASYFWAQLVAYSGAAALWMVYMFRG